MPPRPDHKLRLRNLETLYKRFVEKMFAQGVAPPGLEGAFAQSAGMSPSRWSQTKAGRSVNDELAAQIEVLYKKPPGWLDQEHPETAPDPAEEKFLRACKEAWQSSDSPTRKKLIATIRKMAADQSNPSSEKKGTLK